MALPVLMMMMFFLLLFCTPVAAEATDVVLA